jgi:hypothetical protein
MKKEIKNAIKNNFLLKKNRDSRRMSVFFVYPSFEALRCSIVDLTCGLLPFLCCFPLFYIDRDYITDRQR